MGTESDNNLNNEGQGGNPAWEEFYNAIPENYREEVQPLVNPVLQKWDQNVQQRFEAYKPFEKYVNDKVDPQVVDYAMNLLDTLNDNDGALEIFQQLGSYLEGQGLLGQEEDGTNTPETDDVDWSQVPPALRRQLEELQNSFGTLAQHQLMTQQQRIEADEDEALDRELAQLKEQHGEYDEDWVLAKMVNGMSAQEAVTAYHSWLDNTLKERNRPKPFNVMGSGSSDFPTGNGNFNPRKASSREVSDMIAQKLMDLRRDR